MQRRYPPDFARNIALVCLIALVIGRADRAQAQAQGAQRLQRGTDLLQAWDPGQHVYVVGEIGVDARGLADLEAWLDSNGSNWTVLLMEQATGEVYRDGDGYNHSGADAIEYAVGRGLPGIGGFAALQDERTGQGNGAALVILLRERKFFYSGSESHNRRGLGQESWNGDLDRPAFRAMSNGRRIVDAVKGTVNEVGARLTRRLAAEQKERERQMRLVQQRLAEAGRLVGELSGEIDQLERETEAFRAAHPEATGDLSKPAIALLRDAEQAAQAALAAGAPGEALKLAEPVAEFVAAHRRALANYAAAPAEFAALNAEIGKVLPGREGWGADRLELAREELSQAQLAHQAGQSVYSDHLENSREALRSAREELRRAAEELRAEMARDEALQAKAEAARQRAWKMAKLAAGLALLVLGGLAYFLNRRRRGAKAEAETLVANWESGFGDKTDQLFALLDRTTVVVGSETELPKRGYTGETLRLGKQTIEDVDQLFIMSSTVARQLGDAREEVYPKYGFQRIFNWFGTSRYRGALSKLRDERITFSPEDGVQLLSREEIHSGKPETLLGKLESYQPFALSFPKLMEEFNRRAARATESLDLIEASWASITAELDGVRLQIKEAGESEPEIAEESAEDGLFPLNDLFAELLPSGQADLDEAVAQGATDPVGALAGPLPSAGRKASDAIALCELVLDVRGTRFPAMRAEVQNLDAGGHGTAWVGRFQEEFSELAEEIARQGAEAPVAEEIAQLGEAIAGLEHSCVRASELAARLAETAGKEIATVRAAVEAMRGEIGRELQLPEASVMRESGLDPDDLLREADELRAAASLAVDRGGVAAAEAALDESAALTEEGLGLVAVTRASFEQHADEAGARERETESLAGELDHHRAILDRLMSGYEPSALELSAGDPSYPANGESIIDHVVKAERNLRESREISAAAHKAYREARLIEAQSLLAYVGDLQFRVGELYGEIRDRQDRLQKVEQANVTLLQQLEDESLAMGASIEDPRTMAPTVTAFEATGRDLDSARLRSSSSPGDPFKVAALLGATRRQFESIRNMAQSDRELFDELLRSLQESASHLAKAKNVSQRAAGDRIPDSVRILELQESIGKLFIEQHRCERAMKEPHGDWTSLDREADAIAAAAARAHAEMRGELEKAEAAVSAISSAANSVRDASGWVGALGVRVPGSPGANRLHEARSALMSGRYLKAHRDADDAGRAARQAIVEARSEEDRRRRAAARRAEEARQRRRRRSSSSMGSRSGFGSGGSSRSSSSGRSGMGGSSFRSGGSGMGRSGW